MRTYGTPKMFVIFSTHLLSLRDKSFNFHFSLLLPICSPYGTNQDKKLFNFHF